jgi:hypothetical protein
VCRVLRLDGTLPVVKELLPHYLEESVKVLNSVSLAYS